EHCQHCPRGMGTHNSLKNLMQRREYRLKDQQEREGPDTSGPNSQTLLSSHHSGTEPVEYFRSGYSSMGRFRPIVPDCYIRNGPYLLTNLSDCGTLPKRPSPESPDHRE